MRVIVAGSRGVTDYEIVKSAIDAALAEWAGAGVIVEEVVSGGADGVDRLGEYWARSHGIPVRLFLPDWSQGRKAGPLRNREMAAYADALVAVWDGRSLGTAWMISEAEEHGLQIYVRRIELGWARRAGRG